MKTIIKMLIGITPGLIIAWATWFPLREWLFSMIPPGAEWAFWAKLLSVLGIMCTVGGTLPLTVRFIGFFIAVKSLN